MGWKSKLLKGLAIGGGALATAMTAGAASPALAGAIGMGGMSSGALGAIGSAAGALSPVLGKAAASKSAGNQVQAGNNVQQDRMALDRYKIAQTAPDIRRQTGVKASMVANASPVKFNRTPGRGGHTSITGGYASPNLINSDTRAMADDMTHQMLMKQLGHDSDIPQATPYPGGKGDAILGGASTATSILGTLPSMMDAFKKKRAPQQVTGAQNSLPTYTDTETMGTEY